MAGELPAWPSPRLLHGGRWWAPLEAPPAGREPSPRRRSSPAGWWSPSGPGGSAGHGHSWPQLSQGRCQVLGIHEDHVRSMIRGISKAKLWELLWFLSKSHISTGTCLLFIDGGQLDPPNLASRVLHTTKAEDLGRNLEASLVQSRNPGGMNHTFDSTIHGPSGGWTHWYFLLPKVPWLHTRSYWTTFIERGKHM